MKAQKCEHHWDILQCTVCWFKENPIDVPTWEEFLKEYQSRDSL